MNNPLQNYAEKTLLSDSDLSIDSIQKQLAKYSTGLDWCDAYLQQHCVNHWQLEEGIIKSGNYSFNKGIGLRAVCKETTTYASSDVINRKSMTALSDLSQAAKTRAQGAYRKPPSKHKTIISPRFGLDLPPTPDEDKIKILQKIDSWCRAHESISNVIASVSDATEVVLIITADGHLAADYRPMTNLSIHVIAHQDGKRETGTAGTGGRLNWDQLTDEHLQQLCEKAVQESLQKINADEAPAGKIPVVLGNGWAGVLLHEAVGHGLEGDFNRKRLSAFTDQIGKKVAHSGVTVVDAGNIDGRRGSLSCDDEGMATQENVLIENGVLCKYLQDQLNARLMDTPPTGNGRRESYAYPPMPRMTNTFMRSGEYAPEEIIASVKKGLYAADFSGGEVDITNGNFVFVASTARLIENGKLGKTVKGATIIGNGPHVMHQVSMVGNDFALDPGMGNCGKNGQWVPVGVGQPTIKIDSINVGGTQA